MVQRPPAERSTWVLLALCVPVAASSADRYTAEKCPDMVYTIGCDKDAELGWIKRGTKRLESTSGSSTDPKQPSGADRTRRKTLPTLAKDNPGGTEALQAAAAGSLALDQGLSLLLPKARAVVQPSKEAVATPPPAAASQKATPEQKARAEQLFRSAGFTFHAMAAASSEPRLVQATQLDPENDEAWYTLAQARSWKQPPDKAGSLEAAWVAADLVPSHLPYWEYLAGHYSVMGQRDLALAAWELGMANAGDRRFVDSALRHYNKYREEQGLPQATLAEVRAYAAKRTWEPVTAVGKQRRARELHAHWLKLKFSVTPNAEEFAAGRQGMTRAVELDPAKADYWAELGDIRSSAGNKAEAAEAYGKALGLNPRRERWWVNLGFVQKTLKDCPAAVQSLRAALALPAEVAADSRSHVYGALGECLGALERQDESLLAFEQGAVNDPPNGSAFSRLNEFRQSRGLKPVTLDELKAAQAARAAQTAQALAQAVALERSGQWAEAEAAARSILERQPGEPGARQLLARLVRDVPACREAAVFTDAWAAEQWRVKKAADTLRSAIEGLSINIAQACEELGTENRAAETMLNAAGRYRYLMEQCVKQTGPRSRDEQVLGELNAFVGDHRERANARWTSYQNLCRDVRCAVYGQGC